MEHYAVLDEGSMRLLTPQQLGPEPGLPTFRHSPWSDLIVFLLGLIVVIGGAFALVTKASEVPALAWVIVGPMALIIGLVMLVMVVTFWSAFRASLRPTNWFARLGYDSLHLNLRSYRNAHFSKLEGAEEASTILVLPYSEVSSMGKVSEFRVEKRGNKHTTVTKHHIDLRLHSADTSDLEVALRAERGLEAPTEKNFLGGKGRTKHHHYPVTVIESGCVRVEWNGALFKALEQHVTADEPQRINLNKAFEGKGVEERVLAMAKRGERFSAMRLLRNELNLNKHEADAWLAEREEAA